MRTDQECVRWICTVRTEVGVDPLRRREIGASADAPIGGRRSSADCDRPTSARAAAGLNKTARLPAAVRRTLRGSPPGHDSADLAGLRYRAMAWERSATCEMWSPEPLRREPRIQSTSPSLISCAKRNITFPIIGSMGGIRPSRLDSRTTSHLRPVIALKVH